MCLTAPFVDSPVLLNPDHFAWSNRLKGPQRRRDQWQEVFERVARGAKYDDGKLELGDVLLKLEILVAGQEYVEACGIGVEEQLAVLETCPRLLLNCANDVAV